MVNSAYINTPPLTHNDYLIAKGMLLSAGLTTLDPAHGVTLKPERPANYHYETKGPGIIAGLSFDLAFIIMIVSLRLILRAKVRRLKWGIDDTLMAIAFPMAVAYPALQIANVQYGGGGQHIFDVTYAEFYTTKWLENVASVDFFVCVGVIKMSITGFNIRLTSLSSRKWQITNWTFFALCASYTLVAFFLNVLQCTPTGSNFDLLMVARDNEVPKCMSVTTMNTILRTINIFLDYCLLAVPIILLWQVNMSWRKKIRLFALLSVGGLACIGSIMTLVSKFRLHTDILWNYTGILGWSLVELTLGVLAACLPTLSFLLPRSALTSDSYSSNNKSQSHNQTLPTFAPTSNASLTALPTAHVKPSNQEHNHILHKNIGLESWLDMDEEVTTIDITDTHSHRPHCDIEMTPQPSSNFSSRENFITDVVQQNHPSHADNSPLQHRIPQIHITEARETYFATSRDNDDNEKNKREKFLGISVTTTRI